MMTTSWKSGGGDMDELVSFLQPLFVDRTTSSRAFTHVSMRFPKGRFDLSSKKNRSRFWDLYCRVSQQDLSHPFGILECTGNIIPVLVDVDFKGMQGSWSPSSPPASMFPEAIIPSLVLCYQTVMKDILSDVDENTMTCLVLTKSPYFVADKGIFKHGFHLHFPCAFLDKYTQENELIPRVKLEWQRSFSHLGNVSSFLDIQYCRFQSTPWFLYKSSKSNVAKPYTITGMFDSFGSYYSEAEWMDAFADLDYHLYDEEEKRIALTRENLSFHLPRILSTFLGARHGYSKSLKIDVVPMMPGGNHHKNPVHKNSKNKSMPSSSSNDIDVKMELGMARELLSVLPNDAAEDRNEWMYVGWILFNAFRGCKEAFDLWDEFSKRSQGKYDKHACVDAWNKMEVRNMTIGSLKFIVRRRSPEGYNKIVRKYLRMYIDKALALQGTHNDLAKALLKRYEAEFMCSSIRDRRWYQFKDHVWQPMEEGFVLRQKLSDELVTEYEGLASQIVGSRTAENEEDSCLQSMQGPYRHFLKENDIEISPDDLMMLDFSENNNSSTHHKESSSESVVGRKVKSIVRIISQLKSAPFKTNVMKEATEVFYSSEFVKSLDCNSNLFAFRNGVYDLLSHEFRDGRPLDYISIQSPIRYRDDFDLESPEVLQIIDFFEKVFPDKSIRDYFLDLSSEVFIGRNLRKMFQIWTGEGNNGKSITIRLFEGMLGPYAIKLPTALIVGKRTQSSAACPELVRAGQGVRLCTLQEPDKRDIINIGILKELSGNDTFFARGLYQAGQEISPMFKLVLVCNDPPKLPYSDAAAWSRIRVIPFESKFVEKDEAPTDPDQQLLEKRFPKDKDLQEKVPE